MKTAMDALVVVPSCSPSNSSSIQHNSGPLSTSEEEKKVKKVRRKPRTSLRNNKKTTTGNEQTDTISDVDVNNQQQRGKESNSWTVYSCHELSSKLRIEPVNKNVAGVLIRKRSAKFKYIRIRKFTSNTGDFPVIFNTKLSKFAQTMCSNNVTNIEDLFSELNIVKTTPSAAIVDKNKKISPKKSVKREPKRTPKKGNMLEKKSDPLNGYISQSEAEKGLKNGSLVKGIIRINPRNFKEAYVSNEDKTVHDYMILKLHDRNGALEGDEVVLQVKPQSEWKDGKATASVVYILKKVHTRLAIGRLKLMPDKNRFFAQLTPRDLRIPRIRIPQISWPPNFYKSSQLYENVLFLVQITAWNDSRYAVGMIKENLGISGDLKVETEVIIKEHALDTTPYTVEEANICLKHFHEIDEDEMKYREDLRDECVFTIDPASARDLDDAVSCKLLANGNYKIGVHISDVSYYLDEQTVLDLKASQKATTIYLVNATYHMLPLELCMECSLLPESEKRTFSVFWEITPDGDVLHTYFTRSVIKSCTKLAYEHAQMMIENPDCEFGVDQLPNISGGFSETDVKSVVNRLNNVAQILRDRRFKNGALRIDQPKLMFQLNPRNGEPEEWTIYELKDAHRMIEEFMLLANMSVAAKIKGHFPDLAFLRCHEPPIEHLLQETQNNLEAIGIFIDTSSSKNLQSTLWKYCGDDYYSIARMAVLNHLFAKPMKRAKYFCAADAPSDEYYFHYALNVPLYTHFTSPIRRYADIMVHRLLAASLGYIEKPEWSTQYVAEIAENCNVQKYNAKKAADASTDLYLAHYIESNQPFIQTAVVADVRDKTFEVIVLRTGSVVRLNPKDFGKDVQWKAVVVSKNNDDDGDDDSAGESGRKIWKLEVTFPPLQCTAQSVKIIIERFAIVQVALSRKEKTNKLEARLVPPIPTISFSNNNNNGGSNLLVPDNHDISEIRT